MNILPEYQSMLSGSRSEKIAQTGEATAINRSMIAPVANASVMNVSPATAIANIISFLRMTIFMVFNTFVLVLLPLAGTQVAFAHGTGQPCRQAMIDHLEQRFGRVSGMEVADEAQPIKCLLPYYQMYEEVGQDLSPAARHELEKMLSVPDVPEDPDTLYSDSGKFRILYYTEGAQAVPPADSSGSGIPDYVEWTAHYADSSYRYQVETLGFVDPTVHQGEWECRNWKNEARDTVITISYHNNSNTYGFFRPSLPFEFFVHNNFEGFPPNDNDNQQVGALKVTIAHEFKHVIQYATNCMEGDAGKDAWVEMDATMMENIVHPDVNDYYNYIIKATSVFNKPHYSVSAYNAAYVAYNQVTWMLFFAEYFGMDYWVDVWDRIHEDHGRPFLQAMKEELVNREYDFETTLIRNHLWHLATRLWFLETKDPKNDEPENGDPGSGEPDEGNEDSENGDPGNGNPDNGDLEDPVNGYGFSESRDYVKRGVRAVVDSSYAAIPEYPGDMIQVPLRAASYSEFVPEMVQKNGEFALALFQDKPGLGIGLLARKENGEIREFIIPATSKNPQKHRIPSLNWEDVKWVGVVRVNSDTQKPVYSQLYAGAGEDIEKLPYGNITRSETTDVPDANDARAMLQHRINAAEFTVFERYIGDVSGNGEITPYDAAWIYRYLGGEESPFPVDDNHNGLGPEWERFEPVNYHASATGYQVSDNGSGYEAPDTIAANLKLVTDGIINVDDPMEITLSVPGASNSLWYSLYLELAISYPPNDNDGSKGDPVTLRFNDILISKDTLNIEGWEYELIQKNLKQDKLKLAYASSVPFSSLRDSNGDELFTLQFIPENDGRIQFHVTALELDEWNYALDTSEEMDPIHVMGPVHAGGPGEQPYEFALEQNYPNPFNPETVISFSLPESSPVRLEVYDITGRLVTTLIDEHLQSGRHTVRFDTRHQSGISSGIYLYRLRSDGQSATRKMTLIK